MTEKVIIETESPNQILQYFYESNNLPSDGGQSSSSVKIELTNKLHFYFPNFDARRKAIIKHDIHHILTGYEASSLIGESEISTWEIASGCKKYWAALLIDIHGMHLGLIINPWRVLKSFSRGRRTKNLYHDLINDDKALETSVAELKTLLHLDKIDANTTPRISDILLFLIILIASSVYAIASIVLLPFILFYNIYIWMKKDVRDQ